MAQKIEPKVDSTALGLGLMVLTVCFFTMIDTSAKWLVTAGLPALQVVFARYAMHFILALVVFNSPKLQTCAQQQITIVRSQI